MSATPPTDHGARRLIAQTQQIADRSLLEDVIAGRVNLLDPKLIDRLMPIYTRIAPGSEMEKLFDRAAHTYSDAALEAAGRVLARIVIDAAKDGDFRDLRDDFEADGEDQGD